MFIVKELDQQATGGKFMPNSSQIQKIKAGRHSVENKLRAGIIPR
jgi:hypothetical protein